jgi:peptidoglycan/xylan/chitin deacetylase (PgdA/CDA1 family)
MVPKLFRIKRYIIETVEFIYSMLYAVLMIVTCHRYQKNVLYYHGILKEDVQRFRRQMVLLSRWFSVVNFTELMSIEPEKNKIYVAITFDDGFMSVVENAWPILKSLRMKATMFVPVANLGKKAGWEIADEHEHDRQESIIDSSMLCQLDSEGFEIQSHTMTHPVLTNIEKDKQCHELYESRNQLENILKHKVNTISYPLGIYNTQVIHSAQKAGYTYGVTVEPISVDCSRCPFQVGRFIVKPRMSCVQVYLKAIGAYQSTLHFRLIKRYFGEIIHGSNNQIKTNNTN